MMDRTVALDDTIDGETGLGEMAVYVAGIAECAAIELFGDGAQIEVTGVRSGLAVKIQAMPIESPSQLRVALKGVGAGDFLEADACMAESGIGFPETLPAPEVGQT